MFFLNLIKEGRTAVQDLKSPAYRWQQILLSVFEGSAPQCGICFAFCINHEVLEKHSLYYHPLVAK